MVNTNSPASAVVLLGEIELIDGAAGQLQDTAVASAITSTHNTDDLAAVAISVHRRQTGSDKQAAGKRRAIQEGRRAGPHNRPARGIIRPTLTANLWVRDCRIANHSPPFIGFLDLRVTRGDLSWR